MKSLNQINTRIEKLQTKLEELKAEREVALATEILVIGETYHFNYGKGETRQVLEGVLIAQGEVDGATKYRFSVGEGMNARFFDVRRTALVVVGDDGAEGEAGARTSAKLNTLIQKVEADIEKLELEAVEAEQREAMVDGETYNIKQGKGDTARIVPAVLMGQRDLVKTITRDDGTEFERVTKQFKFFFGEGFDAEIVTVTARSIVFNTPDEPEEADQNPLEQ